MTNPTRPTSRRNLLAAALGLAGTAAAQSSASAAIPDWLKFWEEDEYEFHGGYYDPPRETYDLGDAQDQHGNPFSLEALKGKVVFLYFGYTHCPDACPATLAEWKETKAVLEDDAQNVVFAMITVDPKRDTSAVIGQYVEFWDKDFLGISLPEEQTVKVTREWGIQYSYDTPDESGNYNVNHDVSTYVVDPEGRLRLSFPLGADPEQIAEDVRHLLKGE